MKTPMRIDEFRADDIPEALRIERSSYTHPWSEESMASCLGKHYYNFALRHHGNQLGGYLFLHVLFDEAQLMNLCVHPDFRQSGGGKKLLRHSLEFAQSIGARIMFLEVRVSNTAAIQLYQSHGFNEIGLRKQYYPTHTGREDALLMAVELETI